MTAVLLAVAAACCTALSSFCQRKGAVDLGETTGFDPRLILRLLHQPMWVLGVLSMIGGFGFQLTALHYGDLALVQPILGAELLFVFVLLAFYGTAKVQIKDWLAAAAMAAGLGLFLWAADPSGGALHAPPALWMWAAVASTGAVVLLAGAGLGFGHTSYRSRSARAAFLGAATGISWGFVAAVIKEMSSQLGGGFSAVFSNWSPYVLVGAGALSMLLSTHALSAGPLAASQPGFTILDPLAACLLGLFLFREHVRTSIVYLAIESLALLLVLAGVVMLSRSGLVNPHPEMVPEARHRPSVEDSAAGEPRTISGA